MDELEDLLDSGAGGALLFEGKVRWLRSAPSSCMARRGFLLGNVAERTSGVCPSQVRWR
jgi:hypothetical protein